MVSKSSGGYFASSRRPAIRPKLSAGVAVLSLVALWGADTLAQTAAAPTDQLEEITVTARKREENLQATPIAVTAFNANALAERAVNNITDVGKFVPNVSFQSGSAISGSSTSVTIFIRGIGQTDFTEVIDPGVGVYVDGVYVSRSTGSLLDASDISSIEVLRGPQGTLFGKNTIGGAVVVTTQKPTDNLEGSLEAITGAYDRFDVNAMLNVPITDKFKIRASGTFQSRDGYVKRLTDDNYMGSQDRIGGRIVALLDATDDLSFNLSVDASRNHEGDLGTTLLATNPDAMFASFFNHVLSGANCDVPTSNLACFSDRYITHDPYTTYNDSRNKSTLQLLGVSLTTTYNILDDLTFKSITAYRRFEGTFDFDSSNSPLSPLDNTEDDYSDRQFSQEFQLTGTGLDDKLKWVGGAFFLKEQGADRNNLVFSLANFLSGGFVDNDSYAGYLQGTYAITDDLHLTLGGRYTFEDKRFLPDQYIKLDRTGGALLGLSQLFIPPDENPNGNRILPLEQRTTMANEFDPAITIDYQLAQDILAYASFSKGFKSGGFTQRVFPPLPQAPSFGPEYVDSYEVGFKTEWFDKKLRFNTAAFFTDYTAIQENTTIGIAPTTQNAGKANINGFEMEAEYVATDWLRLNGGLGFTDANYRAIAPGAEAAGVLVGNKLPYVSKWSGTLGATADVWHGEVGSVSVRADGSYRSSYFPDAINSQILRQTGYAIFNASATFETTDEQWSFTAGGTNITSTKYEIVGYSDLGAGGSGTASAAFARPAEWYLKAKYKFGGPSEPEAAPAAYVPPPAVAPAPSVPKSYLVFFDFNKSDLTSQAVSIVNQAAANAGPAKVTQLTVTGHTDTVGSDAYNMRLSRRRAESVAAQLEKDGIAASEIEIVAKGKRDLLVPTKDGVKEPQNRRVQIVYDNRASS
jgi:iron complex outermembrane receptor protein